MLSGILITLAFVAVVAALFYTKKRQMTQAGETAVLDATPVALPSRRVRPANGNGAHTNGAVNAPVSSVSESGPETANGNGHADATNTVGLPAPLTNGVVAQATDDADNVVMAEPEVTTTWDTSVLTPKRGTMMSHYEPGSLPYLIGSLFSRPSVLLIGFTIFATIFIVFYSVFFTDVPRGILSGMFASLGYWIAQQGVARGGQPWFYYLLLVPLYEWVAVFFSIAGAIFFSWRGIQWLLARVGPNRTDRGSSPWCIQHRPARTFLALPNGFSAVVPGLVALRCSGHI